jgi:hypothetical protein
LADGAELREDQPPRVLTARNLRRIAIRTALVALGLAAFAPPLALVALVLVPLAFIELWAVPRVASRGRLFSFVVAVTSGVVAFLAGGALIAQLVYMKGAWEEHSAKAGLAALGEGLGRLWRKGWRFGDWLIILSFFGGALALGLTARARLLRPRLSWRAVGNLAIVWIVLAAPMVIWIACISPEAGTGIAAMVGFLLPSGFVGAANLLLLYWLADVVERRAFREKP